MVRAIEVAISHESEQQEISPSASRPKLDESARTRRGGDVVRARLPVLLKLDSTALAATDVGT